MPGSSGRGPLATNGASASLPHAPYAQEAATIPDLLHPRAISRVDVEGLTVAMALGFAGGTSGGLFAESLDKAKNVPSTFDPATFANDLFLTQFVAMCLPVKVGGNDLVVTQNHLRRLLAQPPADPNVVVHRRAVLAELVAVPALRQSLEALYLDLCRFRALLEGATGAGKWDPNRRHLDILQLTKDILERMATGFVGAQSGLGRLAGFARRVQAGEPYRSLSDLLRYDEKFATLSLKLGIGADGKIRGFSIESIVEDQQNPFVSSPWRRWAAKLELFVRGFRFDDGEIMARLIDAVFDGIHPEIVHFVQLLGDIEFYLGALGFRDRAEAAGLATCLPEFVDPSQPRAIERLFNPLLLAHGDTPVPCDIATDRHDTTVLITGPNSGGKTRLLQSLGLTQVLAQCGLFVPAKSATLALTPGLVVSLIEEAKADQTEGRLGTELMRIRGLFERLPPGAMVILDELCSGTNPSEGEEIFELVVTMLAHLGPQAFITTHFLSFANRLERERKVDGLRFLQVELGAGQRATYQFVPGVAQTSLAAHAAARLGVTGEQLMALVERNIRQRSGR